MSDHIPLEIQVEIIKRLPTKSLIRFRSVSKPWKSLIGSSGFIADYHVHISQPKRLLVMYRDQVDSEIKCVSIDDDDTFPQRKCVLNVPMFFKLIKTQKILGSSHGLLCLYGFYQDGADSSPNPASGFVFLWNPSIRKSVVIEVPGKLSYSYDTVIGFGVCPNKNEPKLVKIHYSSFWESKSLNFYIKLKRLENSLETYASKIDLVWMVSSHVIDGFIYWMASDKSIVDYHLKGYKLIISFDLTSEEFGEICLPDYLAKPSLNFLSISKLRDSLVVLKDINEIGENPVYGVWMMEHGVPNTFTKLFIFEAPNALLYTVLGLRENGKPMLEVYERCLCCA